MALRFVLVAVVTGLGLTLPSRDDVETWGRAAHCWVNDRVAGPDRPSPTDDGAFVVILEPGDEAPVAAPAQPAATAPDLEAIAMELEALAWVTADAPVAAAPLAALPGQDRSEGRPDDLVNNLLLAAPSEPAPDEPTEAPDADRAFASVVDEMATTFAADRVLAANPTLPAPTPFEPLDGDEDLYRGEAYALNQLAEGVGPIAPAVPETRFTQALRLTREAVFAWANVLHGPAVVAIPR